MSKILIVDDERLNIDVLVHILDREHRVLVAKDGEQALRRIAINRPDIVLLDVMMPDMDGYEVCRRLKSSPVTRDIPVIFVTAMGNERDEAMGFALGAVDYITKPISPPVVQARVRTQLELKSQRDRLQELHRQAEMLAAARSDFLAMMSHEIRTPMHGVLGMLELLGTTRLDEEQTGLVRVCTDSARLLLTIIDDILDFSKIDANKLVIDSAPFLVGETLGGVHDLLAARAEAKSLALTTTIDPAVPHQLIGDELRIRQVVLNLLSNAIKFTERGQITLTVRRSPFLPCEAAGDRSEAALRFEVQDTGIGLTEEQKGRLFEPFEQVQVGAARRFGGTGLGLAICRRLVGLMGGRIGVDSTPGVGSTFWFELALPTGPAARAGAREDEAPGVRAGDETTVVAPAVGSGGMTPAGAATDAVTGPTTVIALPPPDGRFAGASVLVAEDTATSRLVISMMLERLGVQPVTVEDGQAAWETLQRQRFDLLLTDCHMPEIDGFRLAARIRNAERPGERRLPIVALTASVLKEEVDRCQAVGMDDVLTKPVELRRVRAVLERWLPAGPSATETQAEPRPEETRLEEARQVIPTAPVLEAGVYQEIFGNINGNARTILSDYMSDARLLYAQARVAIGAGDVAEAQKVIHQLAGASASAGALELAELCQRAESALRDGHPDAAIPLLDQAGPALARVRSAIASLAEPRKPGITSP